jgi:hypothetical protein
VKDINREHLAATCATLAAVIVVAFLCGWSATGLTGGVRYRALTTLLRADTLPAALAARIAR